MFRPKYAYLAYELDREGLPTGRKTALSGSDVGAMIVADQLGFDWYRIEPIAICYLYQQSLAYYLQRRPIRLKRIARLMLFGSIRYLTGRFRG